jgi:serine/threonine protein kinase
VSKATQRDDREPDRLVLRAGARLGKYQLVRRLAVGGMAEIFLARASGIEGFEKVVVLKSILGQHASDEQFVRMFLDEARLAATLHHPNVAQVFDIGRAGEQHFFTMEYVEGQDLRRIVEAAGKRPDGLPLEHAIAIVVGAAAGLHYAHERVGPDGVPLGIVHRDVSASNILVSYDGCVKVVDFGIAKAATHKAATRTGFIKGKVACMSPEQCRGETLDRRSDVFAIGVLLYELTTGKRPFEGENDYAILHQIVDKDVTPPSVHRPAYPPGLEALVLRALRRDRDDRYATAQELQIDLETFARENDLVISPIELGRFMEELFAGARAAGDATANEVGAEPMLEGALTPFAVDARAHGLRTESAVIELAALPASRAFVRRNAGRIGVGLIVVAGMVWLVARRPPSVAATPSAVAASASPPLPSTVETTPPTPDKSVSLAPSAHAAKPKPPHRARPVVKSGAAPQPDLDAPFPR